MRVILPQSCEFGVSGAVFCCESCEVGAGRCTFLLRGWRELLGGIEMNERVVLARELHEGDVVLAPLGRGVQAVEITHASHWHGYSGRGAVRVNGVTATGALVDLDLSPDHRLTFVRRAY